MFLDVAPVAFLLDVGQTLRLLRGQRVAEDRPKNQVVPLPEAAEELRPRVLVASLRKGLAPGEVVRLLWNK